MPSQAKAFKLPSARNIYVHPKIPSCRPSYQNIEEPNECGAS